MYEYEPKIKFVFKIINELVVFVIILLKICYRSVIWVLQSRLQ